MNERIKELRKFLNLTQSEFAARLLLSQNFIAQVESGKKNISERTVADICREFNVNRDWLEKGIGEMLVNNEITLMTWAGSVLGSSDESFKKRFVNMLSKLNEKDWETLERIAILLDNNT